MTELVSLSEMSNRADGGLERKAERKLVKVSYM